MSTFLDLHPSSPSASSFSSVASSVRPSTSFTPNSRADDKNDFACQQLPSMSSALTMPENTAGLRHQRSQTNLPTSRPAVMGDRSRSYTTTSTTSSSFKSPTTSSMTSAPSPNRMSPDGGSVPPSFALPPEKHGKQESRPRSLFSRRSRILRRQGSKFSIVSPDAEDETGKNIKNSGGREGDKTEGLGIFSRHRAHHSDMQEHLKHTISEPFDFQHVTHTNLTQLPPLETTHPRDLATEFSIHRAAQRPGAQLKGIRAESIFYNDPQAEDTASILAPDSQSLFTRSPPTSPGAPRSPTSFLTPQSPRPSRSVENFSRPVSKLQNSPQKTSSPSIVPPPRTSSRFAGAHGTTEPMCQNVDALLGPDHSQHSQSEIKSPRSPQAHPRLPLSCDVAHASTIDDNVTRPLRSPLGHTPELADVPEEDETSWRNSGAPKSTAPDFTSTPGFSQSARRPQFDKPLPTPPRSFLHAPTASEELQSPTIPPKQTEPAQSEPSKATEKPKESLVGKQDAVDDSWEDDIDYCYEHAAESNSNFDWKRSSVEQAGLKEKDATLTMRTSSPDDEPPEQQKPVSFILGLQPPSESTSGHTTPDLQSASGVSTVTQPSSVSPGTAENTFELYPTCGPIQSGDLQKPSPIQVVTPPFDGRLSPDPYDELISNANQDAEHQYSFYSHPDETTCRSSHCSDRCSDSPISKCNSQESMIISRAASIARKHRSSVSTTSVPELVHSSNCSRENVEREQTADPPRALSPRAPCPTTHSRSKTMTREIMHTGEARSAPSTPVHDRAKSASALDCQESSTSNHSKDPATNKGRSPATSRGTVTRKRTYSLFPSAPAPSQQ